MRILKTRNFAKLAAGEGLTDEALKDAIKEFEQGLTGDNLGGNLYKKRVAVGSKGKSGGLRTILVHKAADNKVFCIYVFAKNERDNISGKELKTFKEMADYLLGLKEEQIKKSIETNTLFEVN
jgi:hypothetical protein